MSLPFVGFSGLPFYDLRLFGDEVSLAISYAGRPSVLYFLQVRRVVGESLRVFSIGVPAAVLRVGSFASYRSLPPPRLPSSSIFTCGLSTISCLP